MAHTVLIKAQLAMSCLHSAAGFWLSRGFTRPTSSIHQDLNGKSTIFDCCSHCDVLDPVASWIMTGVIVAQGGGGLRQMEQLDILQRRCRGK